MKQLYHIFILVILIGFINKASAQASSVVHANAPLDSAARIRQLQKNIENLRGLLKNRPQTGKGPATVHMLIGLDEAALKQYEMALTDFSLAIKLNPALQDAYLYRASAYETLKNYQLAIKDYQSCLVFVKNNNGALAVLYTKIGKSQFKLHLYKEAVKSDSTAIALAPFYPEPYIHRAWAYAATGKDDLAILDYTTAIGGFQNNKKQLSLIFSGRGDAKMRLKRYKDAINDYNYSLEANPDHQDAVWNRAACYYYNGDYQLADDDFNRLIVHFKGDNSALAKLYDDRALIEMGLQQNTKAIQDDSLSILHDNMFGIAYWHQADAYAQNADYQLSITTYKKTMEFYQNDKRALAILYNSIANEAYFLADYQKVIDCSSASIAINAQAWGPYLNRGRAYLKKMEKTLAMADFDKVLAIDTTKSSFEYAFALFYSGKPDDAIQIMQKNVLSTTNEAILSTHYYNLACLYSLMNKADEANIYLKKCIDGGYPKKYALNDPDLENIRSTPEYRESIR
jgi:tetratricopeptide (TPR) repeat protein